MSASIRPQFLSLILASGFAVGSPSASSGAVVFSDSFTGNLADAVATYDTDYVRANTASIITDALVSGLSFSAGGNSLQVSGGAANVGASNVAYQGTITGKWTNANDFADVTTSQAVFFSFLLKVDSATALTSGSVAGLQFQLSGQRDIKVGLANSSGSFFVGGSRNGNGWTTGFNATSLLGSTMLIVGQIPQYSSTGYSNPTISLYVNPTDLTSIPGSASATFAAGNTNDGINFTAVSLLALKNQGNNASSAFTIDEVRFGNTWAEVVPLTAIPEPGTTAALLAGLGLAFAVVRRRR